MTKCFICNGIINQNNGRHLYHCAKINNINSTKEELKIKQISFNKNIDISFELLNDLYVNQQWSLPDFKSKLNFSYGDTTFLLKYYNIPIRTISFSKKTKRCKDKFKNTSFEKFGCANPSSNQTVKNKRIATVLEKYGVDNVRKSDWYKDWYKKYMETTYGKGSLPNKYGNMQKYWDLISNNDKIAHMLPALNAYKIWYHNLSDFEKNEYNQKKSKGLVEASSSKIEAIIAEKLTLLNIPYTTQFWVNQRSYDFRISNTNLLIEVNGDFWHANPEIYEADNIMNYPKEKKTAAQKWNEDLEKIANAEKYGYMVLTLWENDIILNKEFLESWIADRIVDYVNEDKINKED